MGRNLRCVNLVAHREYELSPPLCPLPSLTILKFQGKAGHTQSPYAPTIMAPNGPDATRMLFGGCCQDFSKSSKWREILPGPRLSFSHLPSFSPQIKTLRKYTHMGVGRKEREREIGQKWEPLLAAKKIQMDFNNKGHRCCFWSKYLLGICISKCFFTECWLAGPIAFREPLNTSPQTLTLQHRADTYWLTDANWGGCSRTCSQLCRGCLWFRSLSAKRTGSSTS